jgi:hypothetical protein
MILLEEPSTLLGWTSRNWRREFRTERLGSFFVVILEVQQALCQNNVVRHIHGGQDFALYNGQVGRGLAPLSTIWLSQLECVGKKTATAFGYMPFNLAGKVLG